MTNGLPCGKYAEVQRELGNLSARTDDQEKGIAMQAAKHDQLVRATSDHLARIDSRLSKGGVILTIVQILLVGGMAAMIRNMLVG